MNHKERVIGYDVLMAALATTIIILIIIIIVCRKNKQKLINQSSSHYDDAPPAKPSTAVTVTAMALPLSSIDAATDGFNRRRIIGSGPLGTLYAAVSESGELVAVKRIHPRLVLSNAGFGFSAAIRSLSRARHPNVVPIVAYAEAPGERVVVTELADASTLDHLLHGDGEGLNNRWGPRVGIAAGAARGLEYLHAEGFVHGRVKPSNVAIDARRVGRLCDYGLGFLAPRERTGLGGYVDSDYWACGPSKESDVYGLGVVLVEILTGRRCDVAWALPLMREGRLEEVLDPRVVDDDDADVARAPIARLAKLASACVGNARQSRPSASQVAAILTSIELELSS